MTSRSRRRWARVAAAIVAAALLAVYYAGATEHGRRMNTERGRADQSGYLWDAVSVYQNWHGSEPDVLIGERNRMPVYPGVLALFYDPALSPNAFFERGKRINILLSLALLGGLGILIRRYLPPLPTANLLLVIAFGYYIHKAGYVQCELLFYSLLFAAFLCLGRLLGPQPRRGHIAVAAAGGVLAALAHLTKASALPLVGLFGVVFVAQAVASFLRDPDRAAAKQAMITRTAVLAVFGLCFIATLYPYISNSKRVFGHYFYNVNTTFYIWYDDWPSASVGTYKHGDGVGWPKMPRRDLPSMQRYLREHSARQIADRLRDGFRDMAVVTYERFGIVKYVALYLGFVLLIGATRREATWRVVSERPAVVSFLILYALVYLPAIAFYKPISGTTGRMLLAHVAPLLFAISWFLTRPGVADATWTLGRPTLSTRHLHLLVLSVALFDAAFLTWPRLFAHFTGY